jgi:hypothetical protein
LLGRLHIFLVMPSSMESISTLAEGDIAIMQWVWYIFECGPYSKRLCLMCESRGLC